MPFLRAACSRITASFHWDNWGGYAGRGRPRTTLLHSLNSKSFSTASLDLACRHRLSATVLASAYGPWLHVATTANACSRKTSGLNPSSLIYPSQRNKAELPGPRDPVHFHTVSCGWRQFSKSPEIFTHEVNAAPPVTV